MKKVLSNPIFIQWIGVLVVVCLATLGSWKLSTEKSATLTEKLNGLNSRFAEFSSAGPRFTMDQGLLIVSDYKEADSHIVAGYKEADVQVRREFLATVNGINKTIQGMEKSLDERFDLLILYLKENDATHE